VISELVGNAVQHGAEHVRLTLDRTARSLVVGVEDGSAVLPGPRDADAGAGQEGGRGLHIVEALTVRWGVTELAPGKRVWAELSRD